MANSAQGSITIKRLRNGDSLTIAFDSNNNGLWQGIAIDGKITPDWTVIANQPVRTPKVASSRNLPVTLSEHAWIKANGVPINFSEPSDGGYYADSTGTYKMKPDTGELRICKNLVTPTINGNINLEWRATAMTGGNTTQLSKVLTIELGSVGANSYVGTITATTLILDSSNQNTNLISHLRKGGEEVAEYFTRWKKDTEVLMEKEDTSYTLTVGREGVDGSQLFICEFYAKVNDTDPVDSFGVVVTDSLDPYIVKLVAGTLENTNTVIDVGKPVVVTAALYKAGSESVEQTPENAAWTLMVYRNAVSYELVRTEAAKTITVSVTDTDIEGKQYDIDVIGEVSF